MKSYFFYTDQLTVGYDGRPLIKEINIQLNKGEILTLIGPNGAGKSTILKSITRQLSLIGGTVYLEQEPMSRMTNKEVSRKLAVVLTERMRPELMTCEDVVSTGRYPYTGTLGILSACVTAFAGPISFVGIAVPHIAKSLLKTAKPLLVIPACFLGGAVFCLFCDLIARTVFAPTELSISSVTAVFGAPVVIYIMIRRQQRI